MLNITDPVTQGALWMLVSVIVGTLMLTGLAFLRRWQQVRYKHNVHDLQKRYRPVLAAQLRGEACPGGIEALLALPPRQLEILVDPVLSKRKLSKRQMFMLQRLCAKLGLIALWQSRLQNVGLHGQRARSGLNPSGAHVVSRRLRAKSIQNLGKLRHWPSCSLLMEAVNDPDPQIQMVALRAVASLRMVESFSTLCAKLHAAVQCEHLSPPLHGLQTALAGFDLSCAAGLIPWLEHPDHRLRLHASEILKAIVWSEFSKRQEAALVLAPPLMELLLTRLPRDLSAQIRARAGEIATFLSDARAATVLGTLLRDCQWFVRLRTLRALSRVHAAATPVIPGIRECLRDKHGRVREAAMQTLDAIARQQTPENYDGTPQTVNDAIPSTDWLAA